MNSKIWTMLLVTVLASSINATPGNMDKNEIQKLLTNNSELSSEELDRVTIALEKLSLRDVQELSASIDAKENTKENGTIVDKRSALEKLFVTKLKLRARQLKNSIILTRLTDVIKRHPLMNGLITIAMLYALAELINFVWSQPNDNNGKTKYQSLIGKLLHKTNWF